ncbi:MAG: prolipoprotein diacylglyceryl transferase [Deltaproteobacteria bacterium RBG_13_60_28]|nr:MAG: prolipoprotein diacylglyceryl transferase [Deltaproteobacteria bacterium RBG_13_60_28]
MYPVLLKFGPIQIFTYGFFLALASLSAFYLAGREARRLGLPPARFYDLCFYIVLGALVGSRLLYVFLELPAFVAHPLKIFAIWEGGLIFHGGLVAAVGVAFYYIYRYSLPWRPTFDALAVGMPMGQVLGRVGCFMAGCCYGAPSKMPWAVTFTNPETLCPLREPLHPSQLYEALLSLGVFGVVYSLRTRKRFDGQLMLTYFFLAGAVRFVVEFFRNPGDYRGPIIWADMPLTQVVALGIALVSGILLWWFWSRAGRQSR